MMTNCEIQRSCVKNFKGDQLREIQNSMLQRHGGLPFLSKQWVRL